MISSGLTSIFRSLLAECIDLSRSYCQIDGQNTTVMQFEVVKIDSHELCESEHRSSTRTTDTLSAPTLLNVHY